MCGQMTLLINWIVYLGDVLNGVQIRTGPLRYFNEPLYLKKTEGYTWYLKKMKTDLEMCKEEKLDYVTSCLVF